MNTTTDPFSTLPFPPWKASHRPLSEQIVGFGIIAFSCLAIAFLGGYLFQLRSDWFLALRHAPWSIPTSWYSVLTNLTQGFLALSFWTLWRRHSLRTLKLELSLFLGLFFLKSIWMLSLFGVQQTLVGLIILLLCMFDTLALTALFWKKEKFAGQLLLPVLLWLFYLVSINMVLCIANP
ncbi:MAG: tryptophan-rich sensory protein [Verrucomicrobiota bacterium]|nr:tryptophan-rich sensory protein [Verrucomicrobiota bacterium]